MNILTCSGAKDFACVVGGAVFMSIMSQITIPLSPIPVTLQTMSVFLVVALLGKQRGTLSVLTYLIYGAMGLPVFANFSGGISVLMGPSGGYIIGFIPAAYIFGRSIEYGKNFSHIISGITIGSIVLFLCGYLQLSHFVGYSAAYTCGVKVFVFTELAKIVLCSIIIDNLFSKNLFKRG